MACYGDRVGPLSLERPLKASGKLAMTRGVSDSTTLFGFYHSQDSMRQNESQSDGLPESVMGIHIEGPSSEGFKFYPVLRAKGDGKHLRGGQGVPDDTPRWQEPRLESGLRPQWRRRQGTNRPDARRQIGTFDLPEGTKTRHTTFDRFRHRDLVDRRQQPERLPRRHHVHRGAEISADGPRNHHEQRRHRLDAPGTSPPAMRPTHVATRRPTSASSGRQILTIFARYGSLLSVEAFGHLGFEGRDRRFHHLQSGQCVRYRAPLSWMYSVSRAWSCRCISIRVARYDSDRCQAWFRLRLAFSAAPAQL